MKAVINSSPLISLALVKQLELLPKLYDELIIPESVYNEVVVKGKGKTGSEAEVIAIAKEEGIQNVIIDEFAGRQYAYLLGLNVTGVLGILLISKKLGFVEEKGL